MSNQTQKHRFSISTVISVILCILLIPVILMNLILIVSTYVNPNEIPGILGYKPVIVLSGSMEPEFAPGDLIFVKDTKDPAALSEGDVICYLLSGKAVTHRITKVTADDTGETRYITRGDANNTDDQQAVAPDQVQGIYTGTHVPKIGDFALFMQSTTGMIVFIICPLVLFILWDVIRRMRTDKKEQRRTAELEAELAALKSQSQSTAASHSNHTED